MTPAPDLFRCGWSDCVPCSIEKIGCACDGAVGSGCFRCDPEEHQRPPCIRRRRKLLIIDVGGSGASFTGPVSAPPIPIELAHKTPGSIHADAQQQVLAMCRKARCDETDIDPYVWKKIDQILSAHTLEEAREVAKKSLEAVSEYFLLNTKHPEEQAKAAERIAKMHRNKGDDEKAEKQLAKAKKIRDEMAAEKKG